MNDKIRDDPKINGLHRLRDVMKELGYVAKEIYPHIINWNREQRIWRDRLKED